MWQADTKLFDLLSLQPALFIYWGSLRSPHTCGENGKLSICIYICIYVYIYVYIYIYVWSVRIPYIYIHPAPFVRDAIFPHCMLVHVTSAAQDTRLAGQKD